MRLPLTSRLRSLAVRGACCWCIAGAVAADDVVIVQAVDVATAPAVAVEVDAAAGEAAKELEADNPPKKENVAEGLAAAAREVGRALIKAAPQRRAPAQAIAAGWAAEIQPAQADAIMMEIRPSLVAEVSFAKRVCELSPAEVKDAGAAAKRAGKAFIAKYLQQHGQLQNGVVLFNGPQPIGRTADPSTQLQSSVVDAIKKTLSSDQLSLYEAEVAHRNEFRRNAVADNLTSAIDERLYLTDKQRTGIAESLREAANDETLPPLDNLMHGGNYLPQMPDQPVASHLDKNQLQRWRQIPKVHFGISFRRNHQIIDGSQMIDDVDLGDE